MLSDLFPWIGGGLLAIILYLIISNTLWLLFASRILQFLPGVNIKGFRGTLKLAFMIVLSGIGLLSWGVKYSFLIWSRKIGKPKIKTEIRNSIKMGYSGFRYISNGMNEKLRQK